MQLSLKDYHTQAILHLRHYDRCTLGSLVLRLQEPTECGMRLKCEVASFVRLSWNIVKKATELRLRYGDWDLRFRIRLNSLESGFECWFGFTITVIIISLAMISGKLCMGRLEVDMKVRKKKILQANTITYVSVLLMSEQLKKIILRHRLGDS